MIKHPLLCLNKLLKHPYYIKNLKGLNFKRHISKYLLQWKESSSQKPLILRGARQVEKTTLIKDFSKTFTDSILLNIEKPKDLRFFDDYEDVDTVKEALFFEYNISNDATAGTLLFIDEIQESSKAI